jgi:hypothetical protein
MEKEFVPFDLALELKELGFNEPCFGYYDIQRKMLDTVSSEVCERLCKNDTFFKSPTYSQAFRWFREKYKLSGTPHYFTNGFYCYTINDMKNNKKSNRLFTEFETYEEAELGCLKKLIEIVKNATKE